MFSYSTVVLGHAIGLLTLDVHVHATTFCEHGAELRMTLELWLEAIYTMGVRDLTSGTMWL